MRSRQEFDALPSLDGERDRLRGMFHDHALRATMEIETSDDTIRIEVVLPTSPGRTWDVLTRKQHIRYWWGDHVDLDASPGGTFREIWSDGDREVTTVGEITRFESPVALELTWADDDWPGPTTVAFRLSERDEGTRLILEHSRWDVHPESTRENLVDSHATGWSNHLERLVEYCSRLRENPTL